MSYKQSDPNVYATMRVKGELRKWMEKDIFRRLAKLSGLGWSWDSATMTLKRQGPQTMAIETPWSHSQIAHNKQCHFDHHVVFSNFHIIPPKCMTCWKVCMGLPNFASLLELENLLKDMSWPCKCCIELRDYTPRHYGAYFYNSSLEEGRDKYDTIVKIVKEYMTDGEKIAKDIILKRGCTEFELIKGPSPFWHRTPAEEKMYDMLVAHVDVPKNQSKQPEIMKNYVRQGWALWAHSHNDMTYQKWNDGVSLFPDIVKYHEGDLEGIKKDLEQAQEYVQSKMEPVAELPKVEYEEEVIGEQDELT